MGSPPWLQFSKSFAQVRHPQLFLPREGQHTHKRDANRQNEDASPAKAPKTEDMTRHYQSEADQMRQQLDNLAGLGVAHVTSHALDGDDDRTVHNGHRGVEHMG